MYLSTGYLGNLLTYMKISKFIKFFVLRPGINEEKQVITKGWGLVDRPRSGQIFSEQGKGREEGDYMALWPLGPPRVYVCVCSCAYTTKREGRENGNVDNVFLHERRNPTEVVGERSRDR